MVTIAQAPYTFTPSDNPIIWQVESDLAETLYFKVELLEADTNLTVGFYNIYPTANYTNGSYIDLSKILSNTVNYQIDNQINSLIEPIARELFKYKIKITERGFLSGVIDDLDLSVTTDPFYVWYASLNRLVFSGYNQNDYVLSSGKQIKFLTYKPNNNIVNDYSFEQLRFIQEGQPYLSVAINTYSAAGTLLNAYTQAVTDLDTYNIYRLQVSPKSLKQSLLVDFTNVSYYTIHLFNEVTNTVKSETRKYYYKSIACNVEPTNLIWMNSLGGVDSYQFLNVKESNNINRFNQQKNIFGMDSGFYTDKSGDTWNGKEETVSVDQQGKYKATSDYITDAESYWFNELFVSKKAFVELSDDSLAPIMISDNKYDIQRQKYNRNGYNTVEVNYYFSGDIIPASVTTNAGGGGIVGGTNQPNLIFIDNQMNNTDAFDTIIWFDVNAVSGAEGVGATVAAIHPTQKLEFNKINPYFQLYANMLIRVGGVETMSVDFVGDYIGKLFRYEHTNGTKYYGNFIHGTVNF